MKFIFGVVVLIALLALTTLWRGTPAEAPETVDEVPSTTGTAPVATAPQGETNTAPANQSGTVLDLHGKGLTSVPTSVFSSRGVSVLDLSDNMLTGALPAEIRLLSSLTRLSLSGNKFTGVPAEIGQLSKLEYLDLSENPITGLPYELGNLKNLKELDLRGTNYASADLARIRESLPQTTIVLTD